MADVVDVAPGLLKEIEKDFKMQLKENKLIQQLIEKINQGKATYKEANEYAIELGEILAHAYKKNLNSNVLPDGKMYYNIAKRIIEPTMTNNYDLITNVTNQVQEILNKDAKIGIKPITPDINQDRIDGIINRVSYEDNFDDIAWILDEPIVNYSQSIVDDAIKANADFHAKSGMKPRIIRTIAGNCCDWCKEVAGTYSYPKVPQDVYRRHQRCRCTVDYYPGTGKVQNVHSKTWRNEDAYDRIIMSKELAKKDEIKKILGLNSNAHVSIPAKEINLESLKFDSEHIIFERNRKITLEETKTWIKQATFSINVWNGKYERYFGSNGVVYVNLEENLIRTAYRREDFTKNISDSLEVLK